VRRLRYAAEVADVLLGQESRAPAVFKDLQEQLGAVHDSHVLAEWLGRQARAAAARGQHELSAEAADLERRFADASRDHHRRFLETSPVERVRAGLSSMGPTRSSAA
jgi:CHAD domain-containing protein